MNVASLDLCKDLYELSGWNDTYTMWGEDDDSNVRMLKNDYYIGVDYLAPAYDLGYLLRKLPNNMESGNGKTHWLTLSPLDREAWSASYEYENNDANQLEWANTPEDAAAKLAIQLFKQGILKKDDQ